MTKKEFLDKLRDALYGLPEEEIVERLSFYSEMIDDRMEDGLSEQEAVKEIGSIEDIVSQIVVEVPLSKLVKEKVQTKKTLSVGVIILLILGCPLWISLLAAIFSVVVAIFATLFSVIIALWAIFIAIIGCALGGIIAGIIFIIKGFVLSGLAMLALTLICGGLTIFFYYGCKLATMGMAILIKKTALAIKSMFVGKGRM